MWSMAEEQDSRVGLSQSNYFSISAAQFKMIDKGAALGFAQSGIDDKFLAIGGHVAGKEIHRGNWLSRVGRPPRRGVASRWAQHVPLCPVLPKFG
jgi:hypothetical protein